MSEKSKETTKLREGFKLRKVVGLKERPKKEKVIMKRNNQTKQNQTKTVCSIVAGLGTYTDGHKRIRATALEVFEAASRGFSCVQRMPKGKAERDAWKEP